jgi:hypothetical protein
VGGLTVREWMVCVLMRIPNPGWLRPALVLALGILAMSIGLIRSETQSSEDPAVKPTIY